MSLQDWRTFLRYYTRVHRLSAPQVGQTWRRLGDRSARASAVQQLQPLLAQLPGGGALGHSGPLPPPGGIYPVAPPTTVNSAPPAVGTSQVALQTEPDDEYNDPYLIVDFARPAEQRDTAEIQKRALLRTDVDEGGGGRWVGGWELGAGKNATGIWVQLGEDDTVIDRVVIKDTYVAGKKWMDGRRWEVMDRSAVSGGRWRIRKCKVSHGHSMYRIFMDYCQYGHGGGLMQRCLNKEEQIPEPMMWNVFEALVKAAIVMEQGSLSGKIEGWDEVVHRDLKPDNIFFDAWTPVDPPAQNPYPAYTKPVLGDFGGSTQTWDGDPHNPTQYMEDSDAGSEDDAIGAEGYQAPETRAHNPKFEIGRTQQILAHTNVWGIGVTMISFMDLQLFSGGEYDFREPDQREPTLNTQSAKSYYSAELQGLVQQCVRYQPKDRIDLGTLRTRILEHTAGPWADDEEAKEKDRANGMRSGLPRNSSQPCSVALSSDTYKLGLSRDDLPDLTWTAEETQRRSPEALGLSQDQLPAQSKAKRAGKRGGDFQGHGRLEGDEERNSEESSSDEPGKGLRDLSDEEDEPEDAQPPGAPGSRDGSSRTGTGPIRFSMGPRG